MNAKKKRKRPQRSAQAHRYCDSKGWGVSYGVVFSSSLLGSMMQNSANKVIQSFGKSSLPVMIVGVGVGSCEVLIKYFRGKINSVECLEKLGEENTKFLSSIAMGALVN